MNRWIVTGAAGLLGAELTDRLRKSGQPVLPLTRTDLDLTDTSAVRRTLRRASPTVVVNCAAWTDVDGAESAERDATRINGDAVRGLAEACHEAGARLLHVSTDYVFPGGARSTPYAEDEPTRPRTAYGRSKAAGEQAVLDVLPYAGTVVRTAWLYGARGRSFVGTMAAKAAAGAAVHVVDDQHGQPTWARDVAELLVRLGASPHPGIFHATASGRTTWYGLAREVYRLAGADPELVAAQSSAELQRAAVRPEFSVLGHDRWAAAGLAPPRPWDEALAAFLNPPGTARNTSPTHDQGASTCAR